MTIATNTHVLRPATLQGAAFRSKDNRTKWLIREGLLRDEHGRKLVLLDYRDLEFRLKARENDND